MYVFVRVYVCVCISVWCVYIHLPRKLHLSGTLGMSGKNQRCCVGDAEDLEDCVEDLCQVSALLL